MPKDLKTILAASILIFPVFYDTPGEISLSHYTKCLEYGWLVLLWIVTCSLYTLYIIKQQNLCPFLKCHKHWNLYQVVENYKTVQVTSEAFLGPSSLSHESYVMLASVHHSPTWRTKFWFTLIIHNHHGISLTFFFWYFDKIGSLWEIYVKVVI